MKRNGKDLIAFRQAGQHWSPNRLGFGAGPKDTIGFKGCAATSVAIATQITDIVRDPGQVNDMAKANGGFLAGTCRMVLARMAEAVRLVAPERWRVRDCDPSIASDLDLLQQTITLALTSPTITKPDDGLFVGGGFCIVNVDHTGDDEPDHFICVVEADPEGGGWWALDPATGGPVHIGADMKGVAIWGHAEKQYTVIGAAPIGAVLA